MIIKPATEAREFEQIHQLNYATFVEEIPQHAPVPDRVLVDKFHHKNHYLIAKKNEQVIGMVCYNWERPFSLDDKIENLDQFLPEYNRLVEIRLLSIQARERKTMIAYRLFQELARMLISMDTDAAVISGTTRQLKLYTRMGFTPFGPLIGKEEAQYQPMYITLNNLRHDIKND